MATAKASGPAGPLMQENGVKNWKSSPFSALKNFILIQGRALIGEFSKLALLDK